jgi:hypothetical protein
MYLSVFVSDIQLQDLSRSKIIDIEIKSWKTEIREKIEFETILIRRLISCKFTRARVFNLNERARALPVQVLMPGLPDKI